jgi:hypothetical protein
MLWPQKAFYLPPCFSFSLSIFQTPLPQADLDISTLIITTDETMQFNKCWRNKAINAGEIMRNNGEIMMKP